MKSGLATTEAFILGYLLQNSRAYGLELVNNSNGLLKKGTVYVTLYRMQEKGYVASSKVEKKEGEVGPDRRVYEITGKGTEAFSAMQMLMGLVPQKVRG